jgi:hypothetical protein
MRGDDEFWPPTPVVKVPRRSGPLHAAARARPPLVAPAMTRRKSVGWFFCLAAMGQRPQKQRWVTPQDAVAEDAV